MGSDYLGCSLDAGSARKAVAPGGTGAPERRIRRAVYHRSHLERQNGVAARANFTDA